MWQSLVVAGLVAGCAVYAAWTLSPTKLRSRFAARLLTYPHPGFLNATLEVAAKEQGGCGCSGCDRVPAVDGASKTPDYQPLKFQPRAGSVLRPEAD